jgi:hypothetical protein
MDSSARSDHFPKRQPNSDPSFYDSETQDPGDIFLLSVFLYGCLGFLNHPSIRAIMRTIAFGLGS